MWAEGGVLGGLGGQVGALEVDQAGVIEGRW